MGLRVGAFRLLGLYGIRECRWVSEYMCVVVEFEFLYICRCYALSRVRFRRQSILRCCNV
jgi:hypothetical protein